MVNPAGSWRQFEIQRFQRQAADQAARQRRRDRVTVEEPLEIRLITGPQGQPQSRQLTLTMRTPGQDYELAAGLLFAEGVIRKASDIVKMTYCVGENKLQQEYNVLQVRLHPELQPDWPQLERFQLSNASCGLCGKVQIEQLQTQLFPDFGPESPQLAPSLLYELPERMRPLQKAFAQTGGVHAAALFDTQGQCLRVCEDVGRHNALDKLIGSCLLNGQGPLLGQVLLLSGRTSYEMIQKSLQASIPIVAAVGAPSSLAIELARSYGQTLIGFLKPDSFNLYSGAARLKSDSH